MRVERIIGGLALLVACAVALGVAPEVALAEEVSYVDANDQAATVDATEVAQEGWRWGNGVTWYVAKGTVEIDGRVTVSGDVNLILADDAQLTVKGGIEISGDNSLTVYVQSTGDDMGKLVTDAREEDDCAGIGGGHFGSGSSITISGGAVTATGGKFGAGIGGGYSGNGSSITISGGAVTATGASGGAGIGGGLYGSGSDITVSGGSVAATGDGGAGIGGGKYETGSNIKITGGYIKAETAGDNEDALGNGSYAEGEADVTITGGCFAQDAGGEVGTIYGIVPEAGYAVMRNAEETTSESYPWEVASYETGDFVVTGGIANEDYVFGDSALIIKSEKPMTVSMDSSVKTVYGTIVVDAGESATAHVTLDGVSIATNETSAITVYESSLELTLKGENSLVASAASINGLSANGDVLVINGSGSLAVDSGASGIFCAGDLTIEGGHISVRGGGSLDGAINVLGSIAIRDGLIELTGGSPTPLFAVEGVAITGGAFADSDAVTASASDASSLGMVYGVKPAEDYAVVDNANEGEDDCPVRVYPADDASFGADVLQSPIKKEYDGDPVTVDAAAFDPKRGEASAVDDLVIEFAVHTGSTHGDSDWTSGAPADAGGYDLRLTIPGKLVDGTWWRSTSITYLGTPNTNDAPVKISPASVLYAVPSDVILEAAVGDVLADVASPERLDVLLGAPTFGTEKNEVPGTWSWADDSATLDEAGEHAFKAVFTIDEAAGVGNFEFSEVEGWDAGSASFSVDVTVSVAGSAVDPDPDPDPAPPYVPPARPTYEPEVPETDGGTVEVSPSRPHRGDEVTVSPEPEEGQEVREVTVTDEDGEPVEVTDNGDGTWSFEQPAGKVTVTVTFGCDGGGALPGPRLRRRRPLRVVPRRRRLGPGRRRLPRLRRRDVWPQRRARPRAGGRRAVEPAGRRRRRRPRGRPLRRGPGPVVLRRGQLGRRGGSDGRLRGRGPLRRGRGPHARAVRRRGRQGVRGRPGRRRPLRARRLRLRRRGLGLGPRGRCLGRPERRAERRRARGRLPRAAGGP